ncbi:MAG: XrtA/PEP-CTERM system-associated ATPase [Sphingomonadales bacterium]
MYEDFYRLTGRPFQLTPDPKFYYDTRTHRKAMAYLTYGLNQGEGFIIITGDIGAGKTTLVGHLFESLDSSQFVFAKVVTTQLDADDTLRMVAQAFGIDSNNLDKSSLISKMQRFLETQYQAGRRVLLIVDEAQNLPISALEELRMLSNFQEGDRALLQTFLLGQPEFRDKLALSPELEQLRQRVIATHHLEPMALEEVGEYILHRLKLVGWDGRPQFTEEAYKEIHDFTGGVPRRLNNLCSRLLLLGALEEVDEIDHTLVCAVVSDLKADNTPTTGPKHQMEYSGQLSGRGPMAGSSFKPNVPPKMAQDWHDRSAMPPMADAGYVTEAEQEEILRRLNVLERYVKAHDRTLKQMLELLSVWIEGDGSEDPEPVKAAKPGKRANADDV